MRVVALEHHVVLADDVEQSQAGLVFDERAVDVAGELGEFGATITFAGNLPDVTQTAPLAIYISQSSSKLDGAIALSLVLVVVSLVVMIFTGGRSRTG